MTPLINVITQSIINDEAPAVLEGRMQVLRGHLWTWASENSGQNELIYNHR